MQPQEGDHGTYPLTVLISKAGYLDIPRASPEDTWYANHCPRKKQHKYHSFNIVFCSTGKRRNIVAEILFLKKKKKYIYIYK